LTIDEIIPHANLEIDSLKYHRDALNYLLKGRPSRAIDCLFDAHKKYEQIDIEECDPYLLKAKGDCILDAIIISNVYEEKYDLIDFNPDSQLAFSYLWLSFELSHMKLYSSLASLSELFLFFTEGNMIMIAGSIQTLPPSHFPHFFSIVCQHLRIIYVSTDIYSLGSTERRYLTPLNVDISQEEKDLFQIYKSEMESAYKRLDEMVIFVGDHYQHLMPNLKGIDRKKMLTAINQPISSDNQITYHQLFETMIRNMRKSSGGKKITELFKNIPLKKDDVLRNENYYGLYTLIYTDMYNKENKKTDDEISDKLFGIAQEKSSYGNYGFAGAIAQEALIFAKGDKTLKLEIERFIEENSGKLLEKETETNIDDLADQFWDFIKDSDPDDMD